MFQLIQQRNFTYFRRNQARQLLDSYSVASALFFSSKRREKFEFLFAIRTFGESYSRTVPWSRLRTLSLWIIVFSLCAMVSTVAPANSSVMSFWMTYSVTTSIFAVASSRRTILLWRRMALIMQMSYLSPTLRLLPSSYILNCKPFPSSSSTSPFFFFTPAVAAVSSFFSSVACSDLSSSFVSFSSSESSKSAMLAFLSFSFLFSSSAAFFFYSSSCFEVPSKMYSRPAFLISSKIRSSVYSLKGSKL